MGKLPRVCTAPPRAAAVAGSGWAEGSVRVRRAGRTFVFLAAALSAPPVAGAAAADDASYSYVASVDGRGHMLWIRPERVEPVFDHPSQWAGMECIEGACKFLWPPRAGMSLEMTCIEGELPLRVVLSFPKHPDDWALRENHPVTVYALRMLWRGLSRTGHVYLTNARITFGDQTFSAPVVRGRLDFGHSDYHARLPGGATAREIVASAGSTLTLEVTGSRRIRRTASYAIAAELANRVETLHRICGACPPEAPGCGPRRSRPDGMELLFPGDEGRASGGSPASPPTGRGD